MQENKPITIVIFGASGDLTSRKLIPALFSSYKKGNLPKKFNVVGFARRDWSHDYFREHLKSGMGEFAVEIFDSELWETFQRRLWYFKGDLDNILDFENLRAYLNDLEDGYSNRLYYLAQHEWNFLIDYLEIFQRYTRILRHCLYQFSL